MRQTADLGKGIVELPLHVLCLTAHIFYLSLQVLLFIDKLLVLRAEMVGAFLDVMLLRFQMRDGLLVEAQSCGDGPQFVKGHLRIAAVCLLEKLDVPHDGAKVAAGIVEAADYAEKQQQQQKADDLQALEEECKEQENAFLKQIAAMEVQFNAAKQREWEAWKATSVPATTAGGGSSGSGGNSGGNSGGSSGGWQVPCSYTSITSPFGNRKSPTAGASSYHQGVDLDTGTGDPVYASRAGVVTVAGWGNAAGNYVQINHQDGFSSIYMHLSSYCVSAGQIVSAGQLIGATGATGITTGDHLHFGISYNGVYVNPCNYVPLY